MTSAKSKRSKILAIKLMTHLVMCHEKLRLIVVSPNLLEILNKVLVSSIDIDVKIASLQFLKVYVLHLSAEEALDLLTYDENVGISS